MSSTESTVVRLELRSSGDHGLEGICVPYGVTTMKAGYAKGERFLPGAFADLDPSAFSKIRLTDSHLQGEQRRPVGVGVQFRDTPQGLHGAFRFYDTPEGRGARENVIEETYGGLSVGFLPVQVRTGSDGAREVIKARLYHVSLVDEPAYDEAKVLAVRGAEIPDDVQALLAVEYKPEDFPDPPDLASLVWPR